MKAKVDTVAIAGLAAIAPFLFWYFATVPGDATLVVELLWLAGGNAVLYIAAYAFGPLLVLVHELGHGIAAVALTPERVSIEIGDDPGGIAFSLGRIDVRAAGGFSPSGGACEMPRSQTPVTLALMIAAGPLASALAAVGLGWLTVAVLADSSPFLLLAGAVLTIEARLGVLSLVPMREGELGPDSSPFEGASDGLVLLTLLRGQHRGTGAAARVDVPAKREFLSPSAKAVIRYAAERAYRSGAAQIDPDLLLEGIATSGETGIAQAVQDEGIAAGTPVHPDNRIPENIPFSERSREVLDRASGYPRLNADTFVRPAHLMLALLEVDGATRLDADARDRIRNRVLTALHEVPRGAA